MPSYFRTMLHTRHAHMHWHVLILFRVERHGGRFPTMSNRCQLCEREGGGMEACAWPKHTWLCVGIHWLAAQCSIPNAEVSPLPLALCKTQCPPFTSISQSSLLMSPLPFSQLGSTSLNFSLGMCKGFEGVGLVQTLQSQNVRYDASSYWHGKSSRFPCK